ncbi:MAG TPA: hypothetical protein VGB85_19135, partial [Nannocystis sp.]
TGESPAVTSTGAEVTSASSGSTGAADTGAQGEGGGCGCRGSGGAGLLWAPLLVLLRRRRA